MKVGDRIESDHQTLDVSVDLRTEREEKNGLREMISWKKDVKKYKVNLKKNSMEEW